jgi:hypothetical protein
MAEDIIDDIIENAIIEEKEGEISPTPTMTSKASTTIGKVRKDRRDKGQKKTYS